MTNKQQENYAVKHTQEAFDSAGVESQYQRLLLKSKTDSRYKVFADRSILFNPCMILTRRHC